MDDGVISWTMDNLSVALPLKKMTLPPPLNGSLRNDEVYASLPLSMVECW